MGFDLLTATSDGWQKYLLDPESHSRDWSTVDGEFNERFFMNSYLQKQIGLLGETSLTFDERKRIIITAVEAALSVWRWLADFTVSARKGGTHPFVCLPQLAYIKNEVQPALITIVQRLWTNAPEPLKFEDPGYIWLMEGLKEHVPLENDELEVVYLEHFDQYKMDVIEILLRRGAFKQAERLFRAKVDGFPDIDPLHMRHFVYWGMPVETMEVWLNQGLNGKPSHFDKRASTRKQWQEMLARKQQS